jgi:sn-glycerol 3-phosphate transport system ATP-binding protein
MRQELRALQRKLGITMVYVTHDQVEAMSMADRVVLLNGGRSSRTARRSSCTNRRRTRFVARFIGTPPMNLMKLDAGRAGAVIAGTTGPRCCRRTRRRHAGRPPEHVALGTSAGCARRSRASSTWAAIRCSRAASGSERVAVRAMGSVGLSRGEPRGSNGRVGAALFRRRAACGASPARRSPATMFA